MTEIEELVDNFPQAAKRTYKSVDDLVQLNYVCGLFLSEFLSHSYNRRTDKYSGSIENRTRIVREIEDQCKQL